MALEFEAGVHPRTIPRCSEGSTCRLVAHKNSRKCVRAGWSSDRVVTHTGLTWLTCRNDRLVDVVDLKKGFMAQQTDSDTGFISAVDSELLTSVVAKLHSMGIAEIQIMDALSDRVHQRFASGIQPHLTRAKLDDIAERFETVLPLDSDVEVNDRMVGPFYDTAGLRKWLGVTRQALSKRIGKTLIGLRSDDGDILYPSFQFLPDGRVMPNLMEAIAVLSVGITDPWAQAQWVNTSVPELGRGDGSKRSVVDALRAGKPSDVTAVMRFVTVEASRLAA